jgi:hypothetical protein
MNAGPRAPVDNPDNPKGEEDPVRFSTANSRTLVPSGSPPGTPFPSPGFS